MSDDAFHNIFAGLVEVHVLSRTLFLSKHGFRKKKLAGWPIQHTCWTYLPVVRTVCAFGMVAQLACCDCSTLSSRIVNPYVPDTADRLHG